ncbi:MAG: ribosome-associated translation inhibitor RaiA [Bryobacteraceae bacterium]
MKVTYSGTNGSLTERELGKVQSKFSKLSKLVERRGEKGAHVVITKTRHLQKAEVTMNFHDHALVGVGSDGSVFTALCEAIDKLEKQVAKQSARWRDTTRSGKKGSAPKPPEVEAAKEPAPARVVRVTAHQRRKPMTVEEAIMELGDRTHYAFRSADSDHTAVIVRRKDGHIDLIEG